MSDLSNLLGDLYGQEDNPDGPPVRHEPAASERAPEWASDSRLDKAFEGWTPEAHGSSASATSDDDLAAALSAALGAPTSAPALTNEVATMPAPSMPAVPTALAPHAPAAAPAPTVAVGGSWTAPAPASAPAPAPAPAAAPVNNGPRLWVRGDDDIFPVAGAGKKRR